MTFRDRYSQFFSYEFWLLANLHSGKAFTNLDVLDFTYCGVQLWASDVESKLKGLLNHGYLQNCKEYSEILARSQNSTRQSAPSFPLVLTAKGQRFIKNRYLHGLSKDQNDNSIVSCLDTILKNHNKPKELVFLEPFIFLKLLDSSRQLTDKSWRFFVSALCQKAPNYWSSNQQRRLPKLQNWKKALPHIYWSLVISTVSSKYEPEIQGKLQELLNDPTS